MLTAKRPPGRAEERMGSELMAPRPSALQRLPKARTTIGYAVAVGGAAGVTGSFIPFRHTLTPVSEVMAFLALVIAAVWVGGLGAGILASLLGFVAFNWFFIPPYNTFAIERPEYVAVLFVFLGISIVISALLARTRDRADAAEAREMELRALQELSGELVGMVPGRDAYERVLSALMRLLSFDVASLQLTDEETPGTLVEAISLGAPAGTLAIDNSPARGARPPERIPLTVGRNRLGILLLQGDRPLTPGESRVLRAFSDQLALVLERDRLLRVAGKAEMYRATEKLRRALLTAVSHDLRSPLSAIKASVTDLLDRQAPPNGDHHEALETIDLEVDRLNALIANLLDMSRIEAGMLRARVQSVDAEETITFCADRAEKRWPGVSFSVSVDPSAAEVDADPVFLERVITNLLDNAARAAKEAAKDTVEVELRPSEEAMTVVRVIDHGKGVTPAVREHLFHALFGLDERGAHLGPGLGLAISKGFLDAMNGRIWIEDTPGGGATFAFSLLGATPR